MKTATAIVSFAALACVLVFFLISPVPNLKGAEAISLPVGGGTDLPFTRGDTFSSSAPLVVSASLSGHITGLTPGSARITRANGKSVSVYDVTVEGVPVTSVEADIRQMLLKPGETRKIEVALNEGATDTRILFSSTDEGVAVADALGNVTGIGKGTCLIVCSAMNGLNATVSITVE